jgi:hypothetical protein
MKTPQKGACSMWASCCISFTLITHCNSREGCCAGQSPQTDDPSPLQRPSKLAQEGHCCNNPHHLLG